MNRIGTGAANFDIVLQIGSARVINISFKTKTAAGVIAAADISGKTFAFSVKKNKGARTNIFNLTNSNGITVPVYSTDAIRIDVSAVNATQEEGEYIWELRRVDLNMPAGSGKLFFVFDSPQ